MHTAGTRYRIIYSSKVAHYAARDVIWLTDLAASEQRDEEGKKGRWVRGERVVGEARDSYRLTSNTGNTGNC